MSLIILAALMSALSAPRPILFENPTSFVTASQPLADTIGFHARVRHSITYSGDWRLDVVTDSFSGDTACRLRWNGGKAIFLAGAVGFRFPRKEPVGAAVYRLDGGEVRAERDDLPALVALGVPIDRGTMTDPTLQTVWIPYASLSGAGTVAIAAHPGARPRQFRVDGLARAHDKAVTLGCSSDRVFVAK